MQTLEIRYSNFNKSQKLLLIISLITTSVGFLSIPYLVDNALSILSLYAFIPLFCLDYICYRNKIKYSCWLFYIIFLLWNVVTTFWVYYATSIGGVAAMVLNAAQMAGVLWLFRVFRRALDKKMGNENYRVLPYIFFIVTWLSWEYYYFDAQISWPWLVLGNAFAASPKYIQWYEYTGALGGSLWILLSGYIGFHIFFIAWNRLKSPKKILSVMLYLLLIYFPMNFSTYIYNNYQEKINPKEFVVIQPNIDPYNDKFNGMTRAKQDEKLLSIAEKNISDTTTFILAPETFTSYIDEERVKSYSTVSKFTKFLQNYPNANFIFGAITLKYYLWDIYPGSTQKEKPTLTARPGNGYWYDAFNSSLILDASSKYDIFHKSKLVVLAEFVPFPKILNHFSGLMLELGGTVSSYATQPEVTIFTANDSTKIGTAICYESVYGEYFTNYVKKGAQVMTVITNDGWWKNTPGHRQHLKYAALRAIETRRSIARSANTGISALINQRGDIVQRTKWWEDAALKGNLNLNEKITIYVKYGDYIGRASVLAFVLFFLFMLSTYFYPRKKES